MLFICQGSFCCFAVVLSSNSVILSQVFCFVNNFFKLFSTYFSVEVVLHFCSTTKLSISSKNIIVNTYFLIFLHFLNNFFYAIKKARFYGLFLIYNYYTLFTYTSTKVELYAFLLHFLNITSLQKYCLLHLVQLQIIELTPDFHQQE